MDTQKNPQQEQQESDAALARRLHEELNGPEAAHRSPQNALDQQHMGNLVQCPACTFLNPIGERVPGSRYTCTQCQTVLPVHTTPGGLHPARNDRGLVKCLACLCLNRMPEGTYDAVLCGGCCKELKSGTNASAAALPPPQASPTTRRLQVRCGECSCINAVQAGVNVPTIRFECGSCQSINEVTL